MRRALIAVPRPTIEAGILRVAEVCERIRGPSGRELWAKPRRKFAFAIGTGGYTIRAVTDFVNAELAIREHRRVLPDGWREWHESCLITHSYAFDRSL
jgi:hypothetical protein